MKQLTLSWPHDVKRGASDFMPDESNQQALAAIQQWPDWQHPVTVLTGPPSSGKTHLLQVWASQSGAAMIDAKEQGSEDGRIDISSLAKPLIAIDNADGLSDEAGLFHCINHVINSNRHQQAGLLLTGVEPPHLWPFSLPDLTSRLRASTHVAIEPPSDDLLGGLLHKHLSDRQLNVEPPVVQYLVARLPRTAVAIAAAAEALDRQSLEKQRAITLAIARDVLDQSAHGDDVR